MGYENTGADRATACAFALALMKAMAEDPDQRGHVMHICDWLRIRVLMRSPRKLYGKQLLRKAITTGRARGRWRARRVASAGIPPSIPGIIGGGYTLTISRARYASIIADDTKDRIFARKNVIYL